MTHQHMLLGLLVLAAIGGLVVWMRARRATRKAAKQLRRATGATFQFTRTLGIAAGITGFEFLIVTYAHDWRVLLVVLGLPAFFAGRALAGMFATAAFVRGDDH